MACVWRRPWGSLREAAGDSAIAFFARGRELVRSPLLFPDGIAGASVLESATKPNCCCSVRAPRPERPRSRRSPWRPSRQPYECEGSAAAILLRSNLVPNHSTGHRACRYARNVQTRRSREPALVPNALGQTVWPCGPQSHSSAPFFHSYTKPTVSTARNTIIDQKPKTPMSLKATAQGNRKATSRSKMMNKIDTR